MVSDSYTLSLQTVKRTNHLEVERGADPHRVGIDQFLDHVSATVEASLSYPRGNVHFCTIGQLFNQGLRGSSSEELSGSMDNFPASRLVQVIEAVTTSFVLTDRKRIDGDNLRGLMVRWLFVKYPFVFFL